MSFSGRPDPLPARLREVARHVIAGRPMADVGTDHALLPTSLVHEGTVPSAVAIDRKPGPLVHARATVAQFGVTAVELRQGDGMLSLGAGDVDTVVLAGLGGAKIMALADAWPALAQLQRLIIQPNTDWVRVRRWVAQRGFDLVDETMVAGGDHFYLTLVLGPRVKTSHAWADDEDALVLGPRLQQTKTDAWYAWVDAERERLHRALAQAKAANAAGSDALATSLARMQRYSRS